MYLSMRNLLALVVIMFSSISSIIPMFLPYVLNLHHPPSFILMCPLILCYVILMLIWAIRTTCLMCLAGVLLIFLSLGYFSP